MTTEREFREWPEKIRRVRGQRPVTSVHRRRKNSPWLPIVLFIAGLAIGLWEAQPPRRIRIMTAVAAIAIHREFCY